MKCSENDISSNEFLELNTKFLHSLIKGVRNIFLLWLLSKNRMHGYAIVSKINEACQDMGVKVVHGSTIYPLLHSLEKEGLIQSFEEYNGKNKVKSYETTEKGIMMLNSIKKCIQSRPKNDILMGYFDELFFNDYEFECRGE